MNNNTQGIMTQLVAIGAMDTAYQKTHSASSVMSIFPQQDCPEEFVFSKMADAYSKALLVFPEVWGKWSDSQSYPLNIVKDVVMIQTDTFTGEEKITSLLFTLLTKGKLLCDMTYVSVARPDITTKLVVKNIIDTTLTEPLDQLLRDVLLPLDLVKIISFYGSYGIYSPPTPTILYTLGQYYDIPQRTALANNTLQPCPQYIPSHSSTTINTIETRKNLPMTLKTVLNHSNLYEDLQNIIIKYGDFETLEPNNGTKNLCENSYDIEHKLNTYRQFFIKKEDLCFIQKMYYIVGGQIAVSIDPIWLLTKTDPHDDYCVLPIPPIFKTEFHTQAIHIIKKEEFHSTPISIYVKSFPMVLTDMNVTLSRCIIQPNFRVLYYNNQPQTIFQLNTNHFVCEFYLVLCYDNMPCKKIMSPMGHVLKTDKKITKQLTNQTTEIITEITTKTIMRCTKNQYIRHPFKNLSLLVNNSVLTSGSGTFYSEIMPLMYNQTPDPTYMTYKIIFHPTPPILPYDYHYMNTRHTDYLTFQGKNITDNNYVHPPTNYTTVNASRIDTIELVVDWDMEAIQDSFLEPNKVSLLLVEEVANILRIQNDLAGVLFSG